MRLCPPAVTDDEDVGRCPVFRASLGFPVLVAECAFGCDDGEQACLDEPPQGWPSFPRRTESPLPDGTCWGCGRWAAGRVFEFAELCPRCHRGD